MAGRLGLGRRRHDLVAPGGARGQVGVIVQQVGARRTDQGGQLLDELEGLEDQVGRAVRIGAAQRELDPNSTGSCA